MLSSFYENVKNLYKKVFTKMFYSNLISKSKLLIHDYIFNEFNDLITSVELHSLDSLIEPRFAIKYFDLFLNLFALNPKNQLILYKLWMNLLLSIFFIFGIVRCVVLLQINPVDYHKLCVYLGDISLLFHSLRKFTLLSIIFTLTSATLNVYIFNYNHNSKWYELFECFQRKITPKSAGIRNKSVMIKMLIITKITFIMILIFITVITLIVWLIGLKMLFKKFYKENVKFYQIFKLIDVNSLIIPLDEMIAWIFWSIPSGVGVIFVEFFMLIPNFLFQLICFYCLETSRQLNGSINNLKLDLRKFNFRRKFLIKTRIKIIIKQYTEISKQISKYNKFWSKFYFSMMITIFPTNLLCVQQILFGSISFDVKFMLAIFSIFGLLFIGFSSLIVCFIAKEIKRPYKSLIKFQYETRLGINVYDRLKVI